MFQRTFYGNLNTHEYDGVKCSRWLWSDLSDKSGVWAPPFCQDFCDGDDDDVIKSMFEWCFEVFDKIDK